MAARRAHRRVRRRHLDQPRAAPGPQAAAAPHWRSTRLTSKLREGGLALIPLSLYFTDGRVKVELGLARGKKEYDKRQAMAKRDADREIERYAGRRAKGR